MERLKDVAIDGRQSQKNTLVAQHGHWCSGIFHHQGARVAGDFLRGVQLVGMLNRWLRLLKPEY